MSDRTADVVVIGGGPAGAACAISLVRSGCSVLLVDRGRATGWRHGETGGPGLARALAALGLELPASVIGDPLERFASAWGSTALDCRSYRLWEAALGATVRRAPFHAWMLAEAQAAGVQISLGACVATGRRDGKDWRLGLSSGASRAEVRSAFVVEAAGAQSRSPVEPDISRLFLDRLVCFWTEAIFAGADDRTAYVEACSLGWWYLAPRSPGRALLALFTDADLAGPRPDERMRAELERTDHMARLVRVAEDAPVRATIARTSIRSHLCRDRWAAIGDAAWFLDPLSGKGIERAIRAGSAAAEPVFQCLHGGGFAPLAAHAEESAGAFQREIARRRFVYSQERRWPRAPFWARRTSAHEPSFAGQDRNAPNASRSARASDRRRPVA